MLKLRKLILIITMLSICMSFTVFADKTVSLTLPEGFFVHESQPEKVAEILSITQSELTDYCTDNSILYLAVDSNNSRQIRVSVSDNKFSNNIVNISQLTDDKIISLAPDIAGIEGVRGDVVKLGGQKFLKVQLKSQDSGGEYILTQYITVTQEKNFILSFYNNSDINTDYIDSVFASLSSTMIEDFGNESDGEEEEKNDIFLVIIPIAAIAFLLICIGLGVSIIIDIKRNKDEADIDEFDDYTQNEDETSDENQTENQ